MPRRIDTEAVINAVRLDEQAGDPAQPAAGFRLVYAKNDGIYEEDSAGVVVGPFGAGGGGDVATDPIWDAAGDIVQGTGADAAARLAIGTAYQIPRVNSGATALEYASAGRVLISEQTPSGVGTLSWTPIASTWNSLFIEYVARSTEVAAFTDMYCYLNNDTTGTNYRTTYAFAYSTTLGGVGEENSTAGIISGASAGANSAGMGYIIINQYKGTTFYKNILGMSVHRRDATTVLLINHGIEWENTAAVTRVDITLKAGNFVAGSTFRLYGVF